MKIGNGQGVNSNAFQVVPGANIDTGNEILEQIGPVLTKNLESGLQREISLEHLVRARANVPELEAFLIDIGWG